ncbi:MAG: 30S ribosomal protein S20 [Candidatus Omnitrophica bacterium]|nr:30S ribosomal protein S20 [Candidatus Omnitrophota bacterium]
MPIQRTAFKSVRKDKKRRIRNLRITSELKTIKKKFESFINAKKVSEAKEILKVLVSRIDKAASKGIIHRNTASCKIARLTKQLNKLERGK